MRQSGNIKDEHVCMPHIFLDESGQFTKNSKEKYFVIGSFTIGEPKRTNKDFNMLQHNILQSSGKELFSGQWTKIWKQKTQSND